MRKNLIFLLLLLPFVALAQWMPDSLGDGYQMRYVDQGTDYSGPVRSTIIRKLSPCGGDRGVLYVHGYNDYFFQKEMGDRFVDSCYNFYAVDLRKYGRSLLPGQRRCEARDLHEYFADIDSALADMQRQGIDKVDLIGHSTGGLITSLYMSEDPNPVVKALILNSPFLEWNMNGFMRKFLVPLVSCIGSHHPTIQISNGNSTAYGESLLKEHHGEWNYNTSWKTTYPQKVTAGWIRAIDEGHAQLQRGALINVPILLMHSDKSVYGDDWKPEYQEGDGVLNVKDISKYGRMLGRNVTEVTVPGGLHDLILSSPAVRNAVYDAIFRFLDKIQD